MRLFISGHARRDRCQHQDAFKSFAEHEHADVQKRDGWAGVWLRWVGRAMGREPLPYDHRNHADRSHEDADPKNGPSYTVS